MSTTYEVGQSQPRNILARLANIVPLWSLASALVFWVYFGIIFVLAPDSTLLDGEVGRFMLGAFAFLSVAILAVGIASNYIRRKQGLPLVRMRPVSRAWLGIMAVYLGYQIYTTPPTNSQPSSWRDQLGLANWIASIVDKDAVLADVRAQPICCRKTQQSDDSTLEVRFTYLRPNGARAQVTLVDTNPPRLTGVRADTGERGGIEPTNDALSKIAQLGKGVAIGPRDALRASLAYPQAPPVQAGARDASITLYIEEALSGGLRPDWYVSYFAQPKPDSKGPVSSITGERLRFVTFLLEPTTGQVVELRDEDQ